MTANAHLRKIRLRQFPDWTRRRSHTRAAATNEGLPVQSLAVLAKVRGSVTMADTRGHVHAGLRCAPPTSRFRRWYEVETRRLLAEADQTARAYSAVIEAGTVAAPLRPTLEQIAD